MENRFNPRKEYTESELDFIMENEDYNIEFLTELIRDYGHGKAKIGTMCSIRVINYVYYILLNHFSVLKDSCSTQEGIYKLYTSATKNIPSLLKSLNKTYSSLKPQDNKFKKATITRLNDFMVFYKENIVQRNILLDNNNINNVCTLFI